MARKKIVFAALIYWLLDVNFSQNGCSINSTCDSSKHDCLTMENVALGKTAEISTLLKSLIYGTSGPACVAVNGKRDNSFIGVGEGANCTHTNELDYTGWWQVHLGRNYTIQNISIYSQDTAPYRLSEVRITIDGDVCYDFPSTYTWNTWNPINNIQCYTPLTGSTVRFQKRRQAVNDAYYLVLCEVEIWVCRPGFYGPSCRNRCNCKNNDACNNYYGTCPNDCTNNTYGKNCSRTCGSCASFPCDTVTGHCDQCRGNFIPPLCDECQNGWFGESCSQMCINCAGSQSCHRVTGLCDAGCLAGWESPNCNSHLSSIEGTSTAIIVGVLVPFVVVLIVVAVVVFILRRIRRKRKQNTTSGLVELPVIPKECITPSQSQVVTKDTDDVSETLNNYDTLQTGTPEKSIYSALTSRECGSVTKDDPCYYNT